MLSISVKRGYLILTSRLLPRFVGGIVMLAGLGSLLFLAPPMAVPLFPYFAALGLLAELWLAGSLLATGLTSAAAAASKGI